MPPRLKRLSKEPDPDRAVAQRLAEATRGTVAGAPVATTTQAPNRLAELRDRRGAPVATLACDAEIGEVVLGRASTARVRIADASVSRAHAALRWDDAVGAHVVSDLGSANGTFVNRQRIQGPVALLDGARLRIGQTELRYRRALG